MMSPKVIEFSLFPSRMSLLLGLSCFQTHFASVASYWVKIFFEWAFKRQFKGQIILFCHHLSNKAMINIHAVRSHLWRGSMVAWFNGILSGAWPIKMCSGLIHLTFFHAAVYAFTRYLYTVAINELLCMKNAGAQIAMDFS